MELDKKFTGSIAEIYERYMVPFIFQPYADDIARRAAALNPLSVLEIAAGTGVVTRALANALSEKTKIVATDLNPGMVEQGRARPTQRAVEWRTADALALPFPDDSFDLVVCQFGVMFFPDRPAGFTEARRVLRAGGSFIFNTWDRIEENEIPAEVQAAARKCCPKDPPLFLERTPHGYFNPKQVEADLRAGGFVSEPLIETVSKTSRAASPRVPAVGFCQGTPLRNEIEQRDPTGLERVTDAVTEAVAARFGEGEVAGKIQALVVTAR
jgi:SAM-dependent methyltransferase